MFAYTFRLADGSTHTAMARDLDTAEKMTRRDAGARAVAVIGCQRVAS